jgi:hypothetical protein
MAHMRSAQARFVVRAGQLDRVVDAGEGAVSVRTLVDSISPVIFREIEIGERRYARQRGGRTTRKKHPARDARRTTVAMAATHATFRSSRYHGRGAPPFEVNVVRVWEPAPPNGDTAIEWVLLTTESVDSPSDIERVVDIYRRRWLIEDFFKALKTGCSLEKRQITSYQAMRKVLALLAPIAYRLLLFRGLSRLRPDAAATELFDAVDLLLIAKAQPKETAVPKTTADALALLARMGGHIRNNGPPGWMTLGAGYEKLLHVKLGWRIAQEIQRKM